MDQSPTTILETRGLCKRFGGVHVARDVDFSIRQGEIHCLIGPNGAGKSSLFRLILGGYTPNSGSIHFLGEDVTRLMPHDRVRRGMSVKFQVPGIFKDLSVKQNLVISFQHHRHGQDLDATIARVLDFTGLAEVAEQIAGTLSHGRQQWLEIGMAVGAEPALLLLDEPTAGMSPEETHQTGEMLKTLNAQGVTILAVEHDMTFVQQIADRVTVLNFGQLFAQGTVAEIISHPGVAEIYLGVSDD
ncbi:ABC transporter ATP-binding protein [Paracoccus thiocyanatus]|uniref:ABC transporter ATP-binding protein n=2 Tax=Paracoccus thiocyanatus TaxID=34006 RepID=A0A3D8PH45_9RHOB|nr:ABC transporter ATP-binding protein [Paracoccus thiocyanatus]